MAPEGMWDSEKVAVARVGVSQKGLRIARVWVQEEGSRTGRWKESVVRRDGQRRVQG